MYTRSLCVVVVVQVVDSFLLPEMVGRIAAMLNYFLKYLTGPERKGLKVRGTGRTWLAGRVSCICGLVVACGATSMGALISCVAVAE